MATFLRCWRHSSGASDRYGCLQRLAVPLRDMSRIRVFTVNIEHPTQQTLPLRASLSVELYTGISISADSSEVTSSPGYWAYRLATMPRFHSTLYQRHKHPQFSGQPLFDVLQLSSIGYGRVLAEEEGRCERRPMRNVKPDPSEGRSCVTRRPTWPRRLMCV